MVVARADGAEHAEYESQSLILIVMAAGVLPSLAGPICPNPPSGLSRLKNANGIAINPETTGFFYKSHKFEVEIYSAYAPQQLTPPSNYCMRYEAANVSSEAIEKFYWPLSSIQMNFFKGQTTASIASTIPPGRPPTIEETWIHAFINESARTFAFQRKGSARDIRLPLAQYASNYGQLHLAAVSGVQEALPLKQPSYPEIGADYVGGAGADSPGYALTQIAG